VPDDACASYQTLYQALENLEADLHQHIHLENNILFPKAIDLENELNSSGGI
jgi:regulator of cell morphogenesis and NO signaling